MRDMTTTETTRNGRQTETVTTTDINPTEVDGYTIVKVQKIERHYDGESSGTFRWGILPTNQMIFISAQQYDSFLDEVKA